jgi:hypothetical protein
MGYSIFYGRAFIRAGDQFIPLVCSGASNCTEWNGRRWVSERDWSVLNYGRRDRVLFSESEIHAIAKDYERINNENGMSFKTRNRPFAPGEFERWIIGGLKNAHTIEEYRSLGNDIQVVDYPNGMAERWRRQPVSADDELFRLIKQFRAGQEFDITFGNKWDVKIPPVQRAKESVIEKIREAKAAAKAKPPAERKAKAPKKSEPER